MNRDIHSKPVLLVTRNFPPRWGGMEKLNWHIADELAKRSKVTVVAPHGAANSGLPENVEVIEVRLSPLPVFLIEATWRTLRAARTIRPSIVLAGSGLTAPIAWIAAQATDARSAAYVHGLDITVPHPLYRELWLPFLRQMDKIIANSGATATLAKQCGISHNRISIVHPGVTIPEIRQKARKEFRSHYGLGERQILLTVGRLTQRKGILEFVMNCMPAIKAAFPKCILLIIGDAPKEALFARFQDPGDILATAKNFGVGDNVQFIGKLFGECLSDAYQAADIHVFPVKDIADDPEGFGMVAAEAAAHGLPTIGFSTGGISDAVQEGVSGRLIEPGNYSKLAGMIISALSGEQKISTESCREFAKSLDWSRFGAKLSRVCLL